MVLSESLSLVAELAIALAGFASLVAIIGRRQGRDTAVVDAIRLRWMLEISLLTSAFALLPLLPFHAGLSENSTWGCVPLLVDFQRSLPSRRVDLKLRSPYHDLDVLFSVNSVPVPDSAFEDPLRATISA